MRTRVEVVNGDITTTQCDLLVLKYAQGLYGADAVVADTLGLAVDRMRIRPGDHLVAPAFGKLACRNVLYLGVPDPISFGYAEIRNFGRTVLSLLSTLGVDYSLVAMTMHGVGFGLDEREAFTAQVAGILEYLSSAIPDETPDCVLIVEKDANRFRRISALLAGILPPTSGEPPSGRWQARDRSIPDAGIASDSKSLVFVAMPYTELMEDVFEFGIKEPVNAAGCLCERCDRDVFTGDVLDRIKNRIAQADVVVADMTGSNPNVYLEVGYAWGIGVQTLLIARDGEELKFDVKTHRCIYYKNINHLRKQLTDFMARLLRTAQQPAPQVRPETK
jgi:hypothetical protein